MKKRTLILAVLAVLLVLSSSLGSAIAYFTTYATARGGYIIYLGGRTEIHEEIKDNQKIVSIENISAKPEDVGKYPVFVRVRAFADSDNTIGSRLDYSANTSSLWQQDKEDENLWYYQNAVYAGSKTDPPFIVDVVLELKRELKNGETLSRNLDVIVVYESVPALFKADGSPDLDLAWATGDITIHEAQGGTN